MNDIEISVITPTFNRAHTLDRLFASLNLQSFKKFEWIVVDDGSSDQTRNNIEIYKKHSAFPIRYYYQKNGGKHRAVNNGIKKSQGEMILVVDSDDWCNPGALECLSGLWHSLTLEERKRYSGVSVLKVTQDGKVIGDEYPVLLPLKDYVDRFNRRITGDKQELIRRDLFTENLYPEIPGEKYIAPSYPWLRIGEKYSTLFSNERLFSAEYLNDGISKNNIFFRSNSPKGCSKVYEFLFQLSSDRYGKMKSAVNFYRFFFHGGEFKRLGKLTFPGMILGLAFFLYDKINLISIRNLRK